tara:strand:- start:1668 stop:2456 length:789 start_codon:yes stop_codon:yes gene_type:complete
MFGTHFYHKRVRTAVSVFGSLFNNLYVLRTNSAGSVISQVKVPLSYAPKRNFLSRLQEMTDKGEQAERLVAIKLPRMSFEITSMNYDAIRQLPKVNTISKAIQDQAVTKREKLFTSTPYILNFQLNVYAKSQDDSLQIVEQILPFFAPQYTISVKPFSDIPSLVEDVPITLTSVTMQDDYEGAIEQRRTIIYTLDFEMKIAFHGPLNENRIIRDVRSNLFLQNAGLSDSDVYLETIKVVPNPTTVSADSDYGFTETFLDSAP